MSLSFEGVFFDVFWGFFQPRCLQEICCFAHEEDAGNSPRFWGPHVHHVAWCSMVVIDVIITKHHQFSIFFHVFSFNVLYHWTWKLLAFRKVRRPCGEEELRSWAPETYSYWLLVYGGPDLKSDNPPKSVRFLCWEKMGKKRRFESEHLLDMVCLGGKTINGGFLIGGWWNVKKKLFP